MDLDTQLPIHLIKNIQIFFNIPSFALLTNYEDLTRLLQDGLKCKKQDLYFQKLLLIRGTVIFGK